MLERCKKVFSDMKRLEGLECWSLIAGAGTGSRVNISIGEKVLRERPLNGPYLSDVQNKYIGEFSIFLTECSWRVQSTSQVLCGADSPNVNAGKMLEGLNALVSQRVTKIHLDEISMDLKMEFEGGLSLFVFCNTLEVEDGSNYYFSGPNFSYEIRGYGEILEHQKNK